MPHLYGPPTNRLTFFLRRVRKKGRGKDNAGWMAAQRILDLREHAEEYADLARRLGLPSKTLRTYYRGENGASVEAIATVVRVGGVSAHWLLTGEGSPYREDAGTDLPARPNPLLLHALDKARGVVADLERATGIDDAHDM